MATGALPTVPLGAHHVTRLIGGGNPLCANSHWSDKTDAEMAAFHTPQRAVAYLRGLAEAGLNTVQARGDYHRILYWLELFRREGGDLQWIAQTASEMADVFQNIRIVAAAGAIAIYHHGTRTDQLWREGRIDRVRDYLSCMRDQGVAVGLGTHMPEVVAYAEEHGWDVDFYMTCVYDLNHKLSPRQVAQLATAGEPDPPTASDHFRAGDPTRMYAAIQATDKTCLAFKILAAGRRCQTQEAVRAAFRDAFANIKPKDAVVVGMWSGRQDEIALNVQHVQATLAK